MNQQSSERFINN